MPWIVVDVVMVVIALVCLLLTGLTLWRSVKGLGKDVGAAGTTIGEVTARLAELQAGPQPRPDASPTPGRHAQVGRSGSLRVR
ncbi:MAG: hypothetical protein JWM64_2133 [Frankiales bacterium]|nr:hypothetical protein [Frankiales bacterium]